MHAVADIPVPPGRAAGAARGVPRDVPDAVRVGYATLVLVALFNHDWFVDLADRAAQAEAGGSLATQILFVLLALATLPLLRRLGSGRLRPLLSAPVVLFGLWLAATTVLSTDVGLSLRRVSLYAIVALLAAALLVVPRSARQFALALALAGGTVLAASYLGVVFLPALAIHSAFDVNAELNHVGLWRGIFTHKNEAGGAMTLLVICGLYVAEARSRVAGWALVAASVVFLIGTESKTPIAALALVLVISRAVRVLRGPALRTLILVGPVALMSLITVGAVLFAPVRQGLELVLPDATFTARNEIWAFAVENIRAHPVTGWGFGAFWLADQTVYGSVVDADSNWVQTATQAHNSFLDAALIMGLPGAMLTVLLFVLAPTRDFLRASAGGIDPPTLLFLRLWQLCLISASFETVLFNPNTAACALTLIGVFGLRLRTARPVVA